MSAGAGRDAEPREATAGDAAAPPGVADVAALAPLLLFDGSCGLCDRRVRFALARDVAGVLRVAPLDGETAARVRASVAVPDVDSVVVLERDADGAPRVLVRSDAALAVLRRLGAPWPLVARVAALVPRALRDLGYRVVARTRYAVFGRVAACALPRPEWRARLLP